MGNSEHSQTDGIFKFVQENSAQPRWYDKIPIDRVRLGREENIKLLVIYNLPALSLYTTVLRQNNNLFHFLQFAIGSLMDDYLGKSQLSFIFINSTEFLFKCPLVVVVAGLVS